MILFLHHRYRTPGGEERVVEQLAGLVEQQLGEDVQLLERGSDDVSRADAARGLLRGGLHPEEVARAVRRTGARIVHAHNLHPTYGWRSLAAAQEAGARAVLHLHNYRLVCAVGTCTDPTGADCTRCHGTDTRPGLRHHCRGSYAEGVPYAWGISRHQARILAHADAICAPSPFALRRLREMGVDFGTNPTHVLPGPIDHFAERSRADRGTYAMVAARLAREKGVDLAIDACRRAGVPLVIAGDGPLAEELQVRAAGGDVRFVGRLDRLRLDALRAGAALELVPSRMAETYGMSALEAMAAGVPLVATRVGALTDVAPADALVAPRDVPALAAAVSARFGDAAAGDEGIAVARRIAAPEKVVAALRAVYASAEAGIHG